MWWEDFLFKTVEALKWPAVGLVAILIFRSTVASLLARAKSAAFGDKSVEFADPTALPNAQKKQITVEVEEPSPSQAEGPPPPAGEPLLAFEERIKSSLAQSHASDEVKTAWLIRGLASERLSRLHEMHYRLITGSQLNLLLQLNTGLPFKLSDARGIYDNAKTNHPVLYTNFSFEDWINWPKNVGLIQFAEMRPTALVTITPAGRDFLLYLVANGLTGDKPG
jgi:hypothetical protein